jgi:flagellar L-ring protein precursor FlgH
MQRTNTTSDLKQYGNLPRLHILNMLRSCINSLVLNLKRYTTKAHSKQYGNLPGLHILLLIISFAFLSGCSGLLSKLKNAGNPPELSQIKVISSQTDYQDEAEAKRQNDKQQYTQKTNSLWQPNATTFFRDSRAWKVGDILKIVVQIQDSASLNNNTKNSRRTQLNSSLKNLWGKEDVIAQLFSKKGDPDALLKAKNDASHDGYGNISRKEAIQTEIAAVVSKVLANGNLVIQGHQEVRVNHELREVKIAGIIRPKDIDSDNSISSDQIAEARISYGGRGIVSDVQQPKAATQVIDILNPF